MPLKVDAPWDPVTPTSFCSSLQQVVSAVRAGVNPSGNSFNQTSLWDVSSSFFFAGTVITTIGEPFLALQDAAPNNNAVISGRCTLLRSTFAFPPKLNAASTAVWCQGTFVVGCLPLVFGVHTPFIILLHLDLSGLSDF